jgi:phosphoenolpyruvate carboxylase
VTRTRARATRPRYNAGMSDPNPLAADAARLAEALWTAVTTVGGDAANALCEELGTAAMALRRGELPGGRAAFAQRVGAIDDAGLETSARAYALWCHLMNIAEERVRLRTLAARGDGMPDGLVAALDAMLAAGATLPDVQAWFDRALVMPVITAHPTEARRRTSLDHLERIEELLGELDRAGRSRTARALDAEVLALHATEDARARRPTPLDEVENALDVFRRSLFDVTPRLYRTIEDRVRARFGQPFRLPPFFRWGSWVGGDRDGNPNVTAAVTRSVLSRHRALALGRYLDDIAALGRTLSISSIRANGPVTELDAVLERDRERLPEVAARARTRAIHEPWREKLWYVQARLRATLEHRDDGYVDADEYVEELELLDRALRSTGFAAVAEQDLRDAIRRAEVFGFHLASLDLRQHSGVHDRVVDELLARGGTPGYLERDEAGRRAVLDAVLAAPITPIRDTEGYSPDAQEVLATLEVAGRARRELGPNACERYVVSFTREVSDLLEVAFLARAAGLAPGELRPVPLLEQLEDLERAGAIAADILAQPALVAELGAGGCTDLEVMVGYSDSGKQAGYLASALALRRAQLDLVAVTDGAGARLTLFHGRGGAIGRGGGPAGDAIRAQPAAAVRGRIRVTEQGETVTARYANPDIAERDLELMLAAVLAAATGERAGSIDAADGAVAPVLARAAAAARRAYAELAADEDRLARYTVGATPIEDVAHLPLGSRPASRKGGISLENLRAIPWVFSWTNSRHGLPGWFGVGTALATLAAELGVDGVRALVDGSRFVRSLVDNCELSLVRSDLDVAREYARLADEDARPLFDLIGAEHDRTTAALRDVVGRTAPLAGRPYLIASVARRNPHLDVLSHVQIEALRRRRAGAPPDRTERLSRVVFTTINGIAAGLQTVG